MRRMNRNMLRKVITGSLVMLLGSVVAGCGSSDGVDAAAPAAATGPLGSAAVSDKSGCELAVYPSAEWTQCAAQNAAISLEHTQLILPQGMDAFATSGDYQQARLQTLLADPERQPNPNFATLGSCPVDPRLTHWPDAGGIVESVLFTSRAGGTLSGHVWATQEGPAKRPGIVIINGSIIACEEVYWFVAQALAKAGFVVMTFDVQGEGMSDQFGESPDQLEQAFAGTPLVGLLGPTPPTGLGLGGNGLPFYDGGTDALNYFLSTPANPYVPVPSRSSGTSHAPKQERRVAAGLNNAHNPLWQMLDANSIGLAGHSYGAIASSWLGQSDPRVDAVVAWDSLCVPVWPSLDELVAFATAPVNQIAGVPAPLSYGFHPECFAAPEGPAPALAKPALGLNGDYLLAPAPYLTPPEPLAKSQSSVTYSAAGVDSGNIVIRGGTHLDFNDEPIGFTPTTLRGLDIVAWYTTAWFAKYLQHDSKADRMLLSARWRDDRVKGEVDVAGDPNVFSWHYLSRLDITLSGGQRFQCENLRNGCIGQFKASEDCGPEEYSFAAVSNAPGAGPPLLCETARGN